MERLTFEGNFCDIAQCRDSACRQDGTCTQRLVWERLKAYEDAGLSPQACAEAREIEETLSGYDYSISRMVDLMKADVEGRVLVMPCKVGETVYMIERIFDIDNGICDEICARKVIGHGGNALNKLWLIGSGGICNVSIFLSEFGKTVFLTREEAEKALREIQGKEDADGATDKPE